MRETNAVTTPDNLREKLSAESSIFTIHGMRQIVAEASRGNQMMNYDFPRRAQHSELERLTTPM
jgi:hypothetical protein